MKLDQIKFKYTSFENIAGLFTRSLAQDRDHKFISYPQLTGNR